MAFLIETLEGTGKKPGDAELTRKLKDALSAAPTIKDDFWLELSTVPKALAAALAASDGTELFVPLP